MSLATVSWCNPDAVQGGNVVVVLSQGGESHCSAVLPQTNHVVHARVGVREVTLQSEDVWRVVDAESDLAEDRVAEAVGPARWK